MLIAMSSLLLVAAAGRWYWRESASIVTAQARAADGRHGFDFYAGKWRLHDRRLLHPLSGSKQWVEFDGTSMVHTMWNGRADVAEYEADGPTGHVEGMTVRLYDPATREWSIYRADGKEGVFSRPPAIGRFQDGRGEFYDYEQVNGRSVLVRVVWQVRSSTQCRWERAFSMDDGKSWETNWIMDSTRMEGPAL